jgi:flagellar hook-length control protein FliK
MRLNPPELGEVDVRLVVTEVTASVYLGTETAGARDAIQAALPQLRELLMDRNLEPRQLEVSVGQRGGAGSAGTQADGRERGAPEGQRERTAWAPAVVSQPTRGRRPVAGRQSRIDVLA